MTFVPIFASVIVETGVNDTIVIDEAGSPATCTIEPGTYFLRGDGEDDDLIRAVEAALQDGAGIVGFQSGDMRIEFDVDAAGRAAQVHIEPDDITAWTLKTTGTFPLSLLGFTEEQSAVDRSGIHSTHTPSCVWVPTQPYQRLRARYLSRSAQTVSRSGVVRTMRLASQREEWTYGLRLIDGRRVHASENASDPAASFSSFLDDVRDGRRVQLVGYDLESGQTTLDLSTADALGMYHLGPGILDTWEPQRRGGQSLWDWDIDLRRHVSG